MNLFVIFYYLLLFSVAFIVEAETVSRASSTTRIAPSTTTSNGNYATKLWNKIILTVVASLSAVGSVAIIVTYFLWRDLQTTSRRFLVYISIGDFFTVYPTLVVFWTRQYDQNGIGCKLQSFVTSTAVMWSFFWTSSLAIYLYVALVNRHHDVAEKLMGIFHIVNWTVPVILLATAWNQGYLGYYPDSTTGWCWIHNNTADHEHTIIWMLICGKLWEIISYFINGLLYYLVTKNIKREVYQRYYLMSTQSMQIAEQGGRKLALVPVIFVVLRIWGTIRFFLSIDALKATPHHIVDEGLVTLQIIGDNSQGIANFILFCLLTARFKRNICKLCKCCKKSPEHAPLISDEDN